MKTILSCIAFQLSWILAFAQFPDNISSAWIKGDNTIDQPGFYGSPGVPDAANKPGARNFSVTWRDSNSNLWLFGGYGYSESSSGFLNDLWKYDPYNNMWTWVKGDKEPDHEGCYNTKGTACSTSKPGTVYNGLSWTDNAGNLWLFGGFGHSNGEMGFLNSLWKFNTGSSQWTWVKGDSLVNQPGVYGEMGLASASNMPGARYGSLTWKDNAGNLWLFGGYGYDGNNAGLLSDLWKYDPQSNQWTWVNGDSKTDQTGIYGTQGTADGNNKPGGRYSGHTWTDNNGNLWMMGGYGKDETDEGILNDLWKYDPQTNQWTWVKGGQTVNQYGNYGARGTASLSNTPGAKYMGISWKDMYGDLWIFGGYGFNGSAAGYMNDLWKYHPATNEWTWVKGDSLLDQTSIYGVQGMPDPDNKTGSRTGSVAWTDGGGTLWLFGGYGYDETNAGTLSDLWKMNDLQVPLALQLLQFNGSLQSGISHLSWKVTHEAGATNYLVQRSTDGIHFTTIGSVKGNGRDGIFQYAYADQDLKNINTTKVFYRLQIQELNAATRYSQVISFSLSSNNFTLSLFPNPATSQITLGYDQEVNGSTLIQIADTRGTVLLSDATTSGAGYHSRTIDISRFPAGTYFVIIKKGNGQQQKSFIKF